MGLGIQWRGGRISIVNPFPWKRFWCRREKVFSLGDRGFLSDPEGEHGKILNPNLTTFDELQSVACLALLGEPGVGKSWSLSADVNAYLQQSPGMPTIRLDLRSFSSEDRLYRTLFEDETFLQWAKGDYDLHLYIDNHLPRPSWKHFWFAAWPARGNPELWIQFGTLASGVRFWPRSAIQSLNRYRLIPRRCSGSESPRLICLRRGIFRSLPLWNPGVKLRFSSSRAARWMRG